MGCAAGNFPVAAALLGVCAFFRQIKCQRQIQRLCRPRRALLQPAQPRRFENAQGCRLWPATSPATARYGEPDY